MKDKCYADFETSHNINIQDNIQAASFAPFLMWNDHKEKYYEKLSDIPTTVDKSLEIKNKFFSLHNYNFIQRKIIEQVYIQSDNKLKINYQKEEKMMQLMNQFYVSYCKNLPYNIDEQVMELNQKLVFYVVPLLLKEYEFYTNYLRDSDRTNRPLLDRPLFVSKPNMN